MWCTRVAAHARGRARWWTTDSVHEYQQAGISLRQKEPDLSAERGLV